MWFYIQLIINNAFHLQECLVHDISKLYSTGNLFVVCDCPVFCRMSSTLPLTLPSPPKVVTTKNAYIKFQIPFTEKEPIKWKIPGVKERNSGAVKCEFEVQILLHP